MRRWWKEKETSQRETESNFAGSHGHAKLMAPFGLRASNTLLPDIATWAALARVTHATLSVSPPDGCGHATLPPASLSPRARARTSPNPSLQQAGLGSYFPPSRTTAPPPHTTTGTYALFYSRSSRPSPLSASLSLCTVMRGRSLRIERGGIALAAT